MKSVIIGEMGGPGEQILSFPINEFHKILFFINVMISASIEGICVEFWRENNTTLVYLLSHYKTSTKHLLRLTH